MLAFPPTCPELNLDVRNRTAWAKTKWARGEPERENAHNISSSNDSPSATIRRDSYTVSYTMVDGVHTPTANVRDLCCPWGTAHAPSHRPHFSKMAARASELAPVSAQS